MLKIFRVTFEDGTIVDINARSMRDIMHDYMDLIDKIVSIVRK